MAWVYTVLVYTQETWPDLWVQCYFFFVLYWPILPGARSSTESTAGRMDWMSFWDWWIQDVNKADSMMVVFSDNPFVSKQRIYCILYTGMFSQVLEESDWLLDVVCISSSADGNKVKNHSFAAFVFVRISWRRSAYRRWTTWPAPCLQKLMFFFSQRLGAVGGSGSPYNRHEKSEWIRHLPKIGRIQGVHFDFERKAPNNCVWIATGNPTNSNIW